MKRSDEQLFDVRLVDRFKQRGEISNEDVQKFHSGLKDVADQAEDITESVYSDYLKRAEKSKASPDVENDMSNGEPAFTLAN